MSEFVRDILAKAAIPAAFVLCLAADTILIAEYFTAQKLAHDFTVFWRTANQHVEAAYLWTGAPPFPYAPTMLLWIWPLAFIAKWPAYFLFAAASIAAFFLVIRPYLPKLAIALCLVSPPFVRAIRNGQVSALLAALMIWACGTGNRTAAGIAFGCIASIKPQLVIMAPLMLALNRDWRAFIAAGLTLMAAVLLSLAIFGADRWPEWLASMPHFRELVASYGINIAPAGYAERWGVSNLAFMFLGALAGAALVCLCRTADSLAKAGAIGLGSILASPYALGYDLVVVVPFLTTMVIKRRFWAGLSFTPGLNALPLLIAFYELVQSRKLRFGNVPALV